jgi:hypothetical protein
MVTLKWNREQLKRATAELMQRTKYKTLPEFVHWQAKQAVQHLIRLTPPMGGSWPQQKKKGENAVRGDINKVFGELGRFTILDKKIDKAWKKALRARDIPAIDAIVKALHIPFRRIVGEAEGPIHQAERNRRGRVPGKWSPRRQSLAIRGASVGQYIRDVIKRVGVGKWGWGVAARKLGAQGIPSWVTRHSAGGTMADKTRGVSRPTIRMENDRKVGGGNPNNVVAPALAIVQRNMMKQLNILLAKEMKKNSAR